MNNELTMKLVKRFPGLYQDFYSSMSETCMCWGFDHGDGWFHIIWQLSLAIEEELGYTPRQVRWFLFKKRFAKWWNDKAYKLSPVVHDETKMEGNGSKESPYRRVVVKKAPDADWTMTLAKKLFPNRDGDFKSRIGRFQRMGLKSFVVHVNTGFKVDQVKEKFGTLRFYSGVTDDIQKYIYLAERLSEVTCEVCGKPGELQSPRGWYSTVCKDHKKE